MPKYELMYIVASTISDDQIPSVTDGVLKFIKDFGGTVEKEEQLGKKKLAYPIAKTRNGFYDVVTFEMEGSRIGELNTKMLTTEGIVRHIIINLEESIIRMAKDLAAQEKMNRKRTANTKAPIAPEADGSEKPLSDAAINEKIEKALSEDLSNI